MNTKSAPSIAARLDSLTSASAATGLLLTITVPVLQRLAINEGVMDELGSRPTKGQYIAAIVAKRFPTQPLTD